MMTKYVISVPYQETVYGTVTSHIEADSLQEAQDAFKDSDYYMYYYDTEQDGSFDYQEFTSEYTISQLNSSNHLGN